MLKIDTDSTKKLGEIYNLLNQLEVKGINNISILYNSMVTLQQILIKIEQDNKEEPIIIDNTKKG